VRTLRILALIAALSPAAVFTGCVVAVPVRPERRPPPPPCPAEWIRGHYDGRGYWVPGHWICVR